MKITIKTKEITFNVEDTSSYNIYTATKEIKEFISLVAEETAKIIKEKKQ